MKNALRIGFAVLFLLTIYLLPTGIAMLRRVRNVGSVAVLDIFLGWSIIGWAIALAMAVRSTASTTVAVSGFPAPPGLPAAPK